ncbi:hypothetical protein SLINC_5237 [Streptomyces lincolnensis]|uniref:Uncharacterized protein n=1 Tax=Streptomyces lincolnensis TaxID=1915 RepID=A0A1B1MFV7_STRLN|nr:hypothetical protein [Streptomyces lincolnensis]ANS67461.1 hypothetical protein SLINC_5237 [Streptomyces lincolnensis]AXG54776.1 hypothetical protein SLCG_3621 [Streptomyces lincolnensis]QMV09128.1 hypothetical protein GJU35_28130 [Streptomyces lincolnensis]
MRRVLAVHFVPCALFVGGVLALVRAGSFSGRSDWGAVWPERPAEVVGLLATVVGCASLLGLLLQPFQVRAVRVLEGYWDRWPATAWLADAVGRVQRRRWRSLRERAHGAAGGGRELRVQADARRRLAGQPPANLLLPTALGNALRAGELTAGERYGLTTLSSWPRIYLQVSDRMAEVLRSARDALDTAVNLCWSFLALTVTSASALYDEPSHWWLCGAGLASASVAYKGAVTTAQGYSGLMHLVYDLHRFDLLEALHYPLPADRDSEEEVFSDVSDLFAGSRPEGLGYDHPGVPDRSASGHDSGGATGA